MCVEPSQIYSDAFRTILHSWRSGKLIDVEITTQAETTNVLQVRREHLDSKPAIVNPETSKPESLRKHHQTPFT